MDLLKVLLVDDDFLVIQDLQTLVDWGNLGFTIIATASNGQQALKLFQKHKPQLIICDVRMPEMDGLDFIEKIRNQHDDVQIIMISSFEEFQYIKRAMKANVHEYLLKNEISSDSLRIKLNEIAKKYSASQQTKDRILRMLLSDFFLSRESIENFIIKNIFDEELNKSFREIVDRKLYFYTIAFRRPLHKKFANTNTNEETGKELLDIARGFQPKYTQISVIFYVGDKLIIGCKSSENVSGISIKRDGLEIVDQCEKQSNKKTVGFINPTKTSLSAFREIIQGLQGVLQFHIVFGLEKIIDLAKINKEISFRTQEMFDFSLFAKYQENPQDFFIKLDNYFYTLFRNRDIEKITSFFKELLSQFEKLSGYRSLYNSTYSFDGYEEIITFIKTEYLSILETVKQKKNKEYSNTIQRAIEFIKQHFSNPDLSIDSIATHVNLSAGRLSVLFRKETNKTVNDFLTDMRIEQAIYLLVNTNLKIYEVSNKVGYRSSQYFSKVFSNKTGKHPIEYK